MTLDENDIRKAVIEYLTRRGVILGTSPSRVGISHTRLGLRDVYRVEIEGIELNVSEGGPYR